MARALKIKESESQSKKKEMMKERRKKKIFLIKFSLNIKLFANEAQLSLFHSLIVARYSTVPCIL